jgi:hypothetical protein
MSTRNILDAVPELQTKIPLIIVDYAKLYPDRILKIICVLRSTKEQQALYALGRTDGSDHIVTQIDGVTKFSKHNPDPVEPKSKAIDFGVFVGGKYITRDFYYYPLLDLARKYNLVSGIDFDRTGLPLQGCLSRKGFKDPPHIEVPGPIYVPKKIGT